MTQTLSEAKITFVGAGSMAEAIVRGLVSGGSGDTSRIVMLNRSDRERLESLHRRYGVSFETETDRRDEAIRSADLLVLAFKPKDAAQGLLALKPLLRPGQLIVSVIAGMSIGTMEGILGTAGQPIVRTMPNTSSTIGLGATGISFSSGVSAEQKRLAVGMFESTGIVSVVDEPQINIVNGVSGSGPAYIYYMMEAMIEGGVRGGLDPEEARRLTVQTVLGAAKMVETTGEAPEDLRRKVTSPNGTTQAALETLDHLGFQEAVIRAVLRCTERAQEMGEAVSATAASHTK
ncbi:pyrroline-5-carboxylate reductase [Paenibacillus filicis]|uniref:Pyrroline-5-carboxylate reductase n=1 Tax=Paenibacillus gyeongsangnamensis TaxID=3388067 RepID=A0ABT4Q355_9BACL|nr:pyrroline-5-carboxylate reductase [Paenibacillus filicis]MCZ8511274.1 pyrroline-5-carboxylate reductase [Paenibacillus filicis]